MMQSRSGLHLVGNGRSGGRIQPGGFRKARGDHGGGTLDFEFSVASIDPLQADDAREFESLAFRGVLLRPRGGETFGKRGDFTGEVFGIGRLRVNLGGELSDHGLVFAAFFIGALLLLPAAVRSALLQVRRGESLLLRALDFFLGL
jgi:hypothetical protein